MTATHDAAGTTVTPTTDGLFITITVTATNATAADFSVVLLVGGVPLDEGALIDVSVPTLAGSGRTTVSASILVGVDPNADVTISWRITDFGDTATHFTSRAVILSVSRETDPCPMPPSS